MTPHVIFKQVRCELIHILKAERTKSLVIYFGGLFLVSILLTLISGPSSAYLGIGFMGLCFMNVFYAPRQFSDTSYEENMTRLNMTDLQSYIISKMIVLWIFNTVCFIVLLIVLLLKYEDEELALSFSYFIFCFGLVSPVDVLLSSFLHKNERSTVNKDRLKYKVLCIALALIPVIPFPILMIINSKQELTMNIFALSGLITILFTPVIVNKAGKNLRTGF